MKKILLLAISAIVGTAHAATWNMATPYPDSEFHTQDIKIFIDDVEKATNGDIKINLHSGGSLYKAPQIFNAVRGNQVQLGELLVSSLGNDDPLFKLDTLPFLATSYADATKLWQASKAPVEKALEKRGAVLLFTIPWPGQNLYTKEPVTSLDYFKGKKMRTYNAQTAKIAAELGAAPTTVEVSNVPQAFSTGQVDAMMTSSTTGVTTQAWDYVKNLTLVNAWYPKNMVFINRREWRRLDKATQEKILTAAAAAEKRGWEMSAAANAKNLELLKSNGMNVVEPNAEVKAGLQKIGEKMAAEWEQTAGDEGKQILDAYHAQ